MTAKILVIAMATLALNTQMAFAKKTDKPAAATKAEAYKIDAKASSIEWSGTKATGQTHTGTIGIKDGQLDVEGKDIKGGQFTAQMDTITDKDLASNPEYKTKLETHLKSEDFFNVAKFPESSFKIKSVTKKSDVDYMIKGELTMIGKTQEIEFPATVKMEAGKIMGTADITIDRTRWDLKYGSGKFFTNLGDKLIKDDFKLKLNLVANK
jgi:polyisoprenoid-binding protein YceI